MNTRKIGWSNGIFTVFLGILFVVPGAFATVWHVQPDGVGNGASWATAGNLQAVVDAAGAGDEVWVAGGVYTGAGQSVLNIEKSLALYGGFAGDETLREERDWVTNVTTIDGEHQRPCVNADDDLSLDGFSITNGFSPDWGGGILQLSGALTVVNCRMTKNHANIGGGGIMSQGDALKLVNCVMMQNRAEVMGGAIVLAGLSGEFINCTIVSNSARDTGGAAATMGAPMHFVNCILWGNQAFESPDVRDYSYNPSNVSFNSCCLAAPVEGEGNIQEDPQLLNPLANAKLLSSSPCIDAGLLAGAPETDILGVARPLGAGVDMGAYEGGVDEEGIVTLTVQASPPDGGMILPWSGSHRCERGDILRLEVKPLRMRFVEWLGAVASTESVIEVQMDGDAALTAMFAENVVYADASSGAAAPDGRSWETAYSTLQAAVDAASEDGGGEVWAAAGVYTGVEQTILNMRTGVTLYGGFAGTETLQTQRNWKINKTILDGEHARTCVVGADFAGLDGFTVTRGFVNGYGGGMRNESVSPVVANCTFSNHKGYYGGAIYNGSSRTRILNCMFVQNEAYFGPAVYFEQEGGVVESCIFHLNQGTEGSAVYNVNTHQMVIRKCYFLNNHSPNDGGAIMNNQTRNTLIEGCRFENNCAAGYGGALHDRFSQNSRCQNSVFAGNQAESGSAISITGFLSNTLVMSCTFAQNTAWGDSGSVVFCSGDSNAQLVNCVIWGNTSAQAITSHASGDYGVEVQYSCVEGGYDGVGNVDADPLFIHYPVNLALRAGSPCVDAGMAEGAPDADLRGRPRPQGSGVDMGAFEGGAAEEDIRLLTISVSPAGAGVTWPAEGVYRYEVGDVVPVFTQAVRMAFQQWTGDMSATSPYAEVEIIDDAEAVAEYEENIYRVDPSSTAALPDGLSWDSAIPYLQDAVDLAAVDGGGEVWAARGVYTSAAMYSVLTMRAGVTLYGGFAGNETQLEERDWQGNETILDGKDVHRCVTGSDYAGLDGFTVMRGSDDQGAGMVNKFASPAVVHCTFLNNLSWSSGGGLYNENASPLVKKCIFKGNRSSYGIAVINIEGAPSFVNCVFVDNHTVRGGQGGTVYNAGGAPSFINCTLTGNHAPMNGGAMINVNANATVRNSILWGNAADRASEIRNDGFVTVDAAYSCIQGGYPGEGNLDADPMFVRSPGNLRLIVDSPCIDAGTSENAPEADILGNPRPQGASVDMGAYEGSVDADELVYLTLAAEPADGGTTIPEPGIYAFLPGEMATITAQGTRMRFSHWSGDVSDTAVSLDMVVDADMSVTAVFEENVFRANPASSAPTPDGRSWENAFPTLQAAVDAAFEDGGGEVWAAAGIYTATAQAILNMKAGVALYGGFAGTETVQAQRNRAANASIIDGETARRCVIGASYAGLDGFIVRNGFDSWGHGGGMYNVACAPKIINCIFTQNVAGSYGGAMYNAESNPAVINCVFLANSNTYKGGAIYNVLGNSTFTHCTFLGNTAGQGGAIYNESGVHRMLNSVVWGNTARYNPSVYSSYEAYTEATYCCVEGGYVGIGNIAQNPLIQIATNGALHLLPDSPCIDAGLSSVELPMDDIVGTSRPQGAGYDMGAVEYVVASVEGETPEEGESGLEGESPEEGEIIPEGEVVLEGEHPGEGEVAEGEVAEGEGEATEGEGEEEVDAVYFVVGNLAAPEQGAYVLPLTLPSAIAHARAVIANPDTVGQHIVLARIARGASDGAYVNCDPVNGNRVWSWRVIEFKGFTDVSVELIDSTAQQVENDLTAWLNATGGLIGFWSYRVLAELDVPCTLPAEGETPKEGEAAVEGETPKEGEAAVEGETPKEGEAALEGEMPKEGEAALEGEMPKEGEAAVEGETPKEGEGETVKEGEGEAAVEGEGESTQGGGGCQCKPEGKFKPLDSIGKWLGDWLLIGLSLLILSAMANKADTQ